ncbi:hypothetical protein, partial [Pseudomonas lurida]|uniref:hypothetical protein n=1 Tax=Pseudomonas lurida TaxID=244566 RepID=UPI001C615319
VSCVEQAFLVSSPFVVSGLAPRWAAQRPPPIHRVLSGKPQRLVLGPLRSPAQASLLTTGKRGATTLCGERFLVMNGPF